MIVFQCPCGKQFKVEDGLAGRIVECPACHLRLEVPRPGGAASGHEALVSAIRQAQAPAPVPGPAPVSDDIPVAEEVAPPNELAALAQAAATKSRPAAPRAARPATGRVPTGKTAAGKARPGAPGSRAGGGKPSHGLLIGGVALIGLILILAIIFAVKVAGRPTQQPVAQPPAVYIPPQPARSKGNSTAGELFKNVPFEKREDEATPAR